VEDPPENIDANSLAIVGLPSSRIAMRASSWTVIWLKNARNWRTSRGCAESWMGDFLEIDYLIRRVPQSLKSQLCVRIESIRIRFRADSHLGKISPNRQRFEDRFRPASSRLGELKRHARQEVHIGECPSRYR
jgi:hypothetical protein